MYDELVNTLRKTSCFDCEPCDHRNTCEAEGCFIQKAADAIEELNGFVQEAERDRDEYRERLDKSNDAIGELSRRETPMKITEIHVDEYYCPACRAENNCDEGDVQDTYCPACGQRLLPELPKEEV